ncbi:MAG: DUF3352 domain-containing protein [Puniceicoccales bacterium]|jgi:hypothetical protein|nr:DUF3352 domain-containing protein [Puniceicoccales bacterium]
MKFSRLFRLPCAILLAALPLAPFANARHEKSLPEETYFALQFRDLADYKAKDAKHPFSVDFRAAGYADYFAPGIALLKEEIQKGLAKCSKNADFERYLSILQNDFNGEILFALVKTPKPVEGHEPFDFVFFADTDLAETALNEILKDLGVYTKRSEKVSSTAYLAEKGASAIDDDAEIGAVADADGKVSRTTEIVKTPFQGVTLHEVTISYPDNKFSFVPVGWAFVGKTFVFATAPNVLRELIDAMQNGRKNSFADSIPWRRASKAAGNADFLFVSTPQLASAALRKVVATAGPNMYLPEPLKAYDALALDVIDGLWCSSTLTETAAVSKLSLSYKEKRGLLSLFTSKPLEQPVPEYIPAGLPHFSVTAFDMSESWRNLEKLLADAVPHLKPFLDQGLEKMKKEEGLDIRSDLLENFGEKIVVISGGASIRPKVKGVNSPLRNPMLLVLEIRDVNKLQSLIDTSLSKAGPEGKKAILDERVFMGVNISSAKQGKDAKLSYAIHDGKLFLAIDGEKILDEVIAEIKEPRSPIAKEAFVRQALKLVPKEKSSFEVIDLGKSIDATFSTFEFLVKEFLLKRIGKEGAPLTDPTKKPAPSVLPWASVSYGELRDNEIYAETHLYKKEEK